MMNGTIRQLNFRIVRRSSEVTSDQPSNLPTFMPRHILALVEHIG
jgi:hypothetical protein